MLGKNQMNLINACTEEFKDVLIQMFEMRGDKPFTDADFYIETEWCSGEQAETAYQLDKKDKEKDDLIRQNKLLKEQLSTYNEVNKKLQEVYEAYRKAEADNFFKEMGILDK